MKCKGISEVVHESISDLHEIGLVDEMTMRKFDARCLPEVKQCTAIEIKAIRQKYKLSQAVFAQYLNTSVETVKKWESRGAAAKRPNGVALKLLSVVEQYGLSVLDGTFSLSADNSMPTMTKQKAIHKSNHKAVA